MPFVSFIAVSYNHSKFLIETLNSIKNQSFVIDFEIIITDDASKDNSVELIQDWVAQNKNKIKIQTLFNSENIGLCKTLNCAIGLANGHWIKPIACDDILELNYLDSVISVVNSYNTIGLVCTDMSHIKSDGTMIRESNWEYNQTEISNEIVNDFNNLLKGQYLNAPTLLYKKEIWEQLGGYDETLIFEDWDFLLRAKKRTKFVVIKESLVCYRMHDNNMHLNFKTNERYLVDSILLLKKHLTKETKDVVRNEVIKQIASLLPINENKAIEFWEQEYEWLKSDKKGPLVSVFIPAYNAELYIENAIRTCLLQTYTNFEIIIVNDGSTDNTSVIVEKLKNTEDRIQIYHNETNLGLSPTRNRGVELCKGDYIALLDADDLMHPMRLEKQVEYLINNQEYNAVSSWMEQFDESGNRKRIRYSKDLNKIKSKSIFYSPVSHAASMFKANVLKKLGYRKEFIFAEDHDLWIRFLQNYSIDVIPVVLYYYRSHATQSIKPGNEIRKEQSYLNIIQSIHTYFKIDSTDKLRRIHLKYLFQEEKMDNYILFRQWEDYLKKLLNTNQGYLDSSTFRNFVFANYWQNNFIKCYSKFNIIQCIMLLQSPFSRFTNIQKFRFLVKKLFK
jgi:glycosyltransferase involved in cell wall biosynthesis